jgi:hypothetical protein
MAAKEYDIESICVPALEVAYHALDEYSDPDCQDEQALAKFLPCATSWMFTDEKFVPLVAAILVTNAAQLHTKQVFQELLKASPVLGRHLFTAFAVMAAARRLYLIR